MHALRADGHGRPAALDQAALLVCADKACVADGGGRVRGQRAALHIARADDAVVAADHAAEHRAGVGGDVRVDDGAVFNAAVVVVNKHGGVVREEDVRALDGQAVDIGGRADVPEET